jgi:hypothetical protein
MRAQRKELLSLPKVQKIQITGELLPKKVSLKYLVAIHNWLPEILKKYGECFLDHLLKSLRLVIILEKLKICGIYLSLLLARASFTWLLLAVVQA